MQKRRQIEVTARESNRTLNNDSPVNSIHVGALAKEALLNGKPLHCLVSTVLTPIYMPGIQVHI